MGTRINYEIVSYETGTRTVAAILYSNCSHPIANAESVFRDLVYHTNGPTKLVRELLLQKYFSAGGSHRSGDYIFSIDTCPMDREKVIEVNYGVCVDGKTLADPVVSERPA